MIDSWGAWFLDLLPGLVVSLELTAMFLLLGLPYGLLLAVGGLQKSGLVRWPSLVVMELGRGVPALVLIYLVYFGLPQADLTLEAFLSASIALAISFGSYISEVFRSGFTTLPQGQLDAAAALGLPRSTTFRRVVLPQALKIVFPPLLGWTIVYFQATSLAFAIAVPELLSRAYTLATINFEYLSLLAAAGIMYAAICIPASLVVEHLGRRRSAPKQG